MALVFGDISGGPSDRVLTAACYLGTERQWENASKRWTALLLEAGVSHFHASDFYACRGEFKTWTMNGERHVVFAKRFAAVADDAGLIGFAWACDQEAFRSVLAPELEKEQRRFRSNDPRIHATMSALSSVARFLGEANHPSLYSVTIGFEHEAGAGRFVDFFEEAKARQEAWTRWFHRFTIAPKEFEPIQVADLLAHEAWRRAKELVANNPRAIRKSFARMLLRERVELRWQSREQVIEHARLVREILAQYPDGLIPPLDSSGQDTGG